MLKPSEYFKEEFEKKQKEIISIAFSISYETTDRKNDPFDLFRDKIKKNIQSYKEDGCDMLLSYITCVFEKENLTIPKERLEQLKEICDNMETLYNLEQQAFEHERDSMELKSIKELFKIIKKY